MPDPAVPEAPRTTNQEALHMNRPEVNIAGAGITDERFNEIQRIRREATDPRDFLKKMAENGGAPSFSAENAANLQLSFGGGKAKKNEDSGIIEFKGDAGSVEEQRFLEAQTVVAEITNLQKYTDLLSKAAAAGKTPEQFAADATPPLNLNEIRTNGLNSINNELLTQIDPELAGATPDVIKQVIDIRIIQDPAFRRELAGLLSNAKLPRTEIAENAEAGKLSKNKEDLETRNGALRDQVVEQIKYALKNSKIEEAAIDDDVIKIIDDQLKYGRNTDNIMYEIEFDLAGKLFPDRFQYISFLKTQNEIAKLQQELLRPGIKDTQKESIKAQIKDVKSSAKWEGDTYDAWKTKLEGNEGYKAYLNLKSALSYGKSGTQYESPIARKVQEKLLVTSEINQVEEKLAKAQTEGNLASSKTKDERLEQERQALAELRGIIPQAIAKIILERAQKADEVRARENRQQFDRETQEMYDTVRQSMRERGMGNRMVGERAVPTRNRNTIVADARDLAMEKDDGLRRLTLLHMGLLDQPRTNDQGEPVENDDGEALNIATIDDLNARQRAMFDRIFASEGQAIKMKVARDLVTSQTLAGRIMDKIPGSEKNGLSTIEWEEFGKYYNNDMKQIVTQSREGRDAIARLEQAGIKPESSRWNRILTWLAIILGSGVSIAAFGGLDTIIPTVAGQGIAGIKAVATGLGSGSGAVEAVVKGA